MIIILNWVGTLKQCHIYQCINLRINETACVCIVAMEIGGRSFVYLSQGNCDCYCRHNYDYNYYEQTIPG